MLISPSTTKMIKLPPPIMNILIFQIPLLPILPNILVKVFILKTLTNSYRSISRLLLFALSPTITIIFEIIFTRIFILIKIIKLTPHIIQPIFPPIFLTIINRNIFILTLQLYIMGISNSVHIHYLTIFLTQN